VTAGAARQHDRIAFVQTGPFPYANVFVEEQLRRSFPEYQVDVINVLDLVRSSRTRVARLVTEAVRLYGVDMARGRRLLRAAYVHTPYFFRTARDLVLARLQQKQYRFSFQMQSLFDASFGQLPHFIYTDHTNLANLYYRQATTAVLYPESWRRLEATIYRNATLLFVRSRHVERSLVEQYGVPESRIRIVYAGSNASSSRAAGEEPGRERFAARRILFVGSDWPRKGGPMLLEAFRKVRAELPDAELVLVGKTPAVDEPGVTVLGELPLERVGDEYLRSTVLCVPTQLEPFGIVFVEAMSYGIPIVATTVGALPDMVEDGVNGYLVAPTDVDGLARQLIAVLIDPEAAAAMGARSKELANERYSWDAVGRRMAEHIRATLAAAGEPGNG